MTYSISRIAEILGLPAPRYPMHDISELLTDSRSLTYPARSLFFALRTRNNDGHKYIPELCDKGVRDFVVDRIPTELENKADINFLVVPDVIKALQAIARYHRSQFSIPVIGITGSRGKTTVKEWLYQLLQPDFNIVRSPRSYNSQIGVPLSIWELNEETQLAIFEAGISQPGEMSALQAIIRPTIGLITNIGSEHRDGFISKELKCEEKVSLLHDCQCVVYDADDKLISSSIQASHTSAQQLAWSVKDSSSPLFIAKTEKKHTSTIITYSYQDIEHSIEIPFTADADIENAIHCLAIMLQLHRDPETIRTRMAALTPVGTRLNVIEGVNHCLLIHDSYTSDLHSLAPALDFMARRETSDLTTTVILSDVTHEDMEPHELYRAIAQLLKQRGIRRFIGIGPEMVKHEKYFDENSIFYRSTEDFLSAVSASDFDHELILIKGAGHFDFDQISDMLEARQHETVLEVNLDSIVHNYNHMRSGLKPETGVVCMVKASGYGAGSYELAKTLHSQGAAYLAVAVLDEGVDLRKAGITMPIMVLNPKVVNYRTLFSYNLEPEIYSFEILEEIIKEAEKYGITNYPVHIKLDTGMHRLGFLEKDMAQLVAVLKSQTAVTPKSVFSHLAAADCFDMDDYTAEQFAIFDRCCDTLQSGFKHHILRHILNSAGITRFPEHQCDMVRLGICLYGIPALSDGSQNGLRPVSALRTIVISIKEWEAGTTIGYSRRGVLYRHSRIATIPIGYADGLDRHLGNGNASFLINGHRCPTIGNICMDICMIDVTDAPCEVGDSVEIFGPEISVCELAETLETIPYEILTSVSSRVKRVYFRE